MTGMELKQLDLPGQIMEVIDRTSPVMGWDIWTRIAEEMGWDAQDQTLYRRFKRELGGLAARGHIAAVTVAKNRARSTWDLTEEGEVWWNTDGPNVHRVSNGDAREVMEDFVVGKWLGKDRVPKNARTWTRIASAALRGEIQVALRRVPGDGTKTTGGSGR